MKFELRFAVLLSRRSVSVAAVFCCVESAISQDATTSARLNIKKFSNILHCRLVNYSHIIACIVEEGAFIVYVKLRGKRGTITYYVPTIATPETRTG